MKKIVLIMMAVLFVGGSLKAQDSTREAMFPGGNLGWKNYLNKTLNTSVLDYINIPKGKKSAKVKVIVEFWVDKEGNIDSVRADDVSIATINEKIVAEAIRVIKEGPKWIPAIFHGNPIRYRTRQPITFIADKD